ncbi:MAG: hypothetical protein SPD11_14145 [Sphaerochaetaceae bacterium]|nr:hypothetical protein [Sphaerochaetaceae bacterium]
MRFAYIGERTIRNHISMIYTKFGLNGRKESLEKNPYCQSVPVRLVRFSHILRQLAHDSSIFDRLFFGVALGKNPCQFVSVVYNSLQERTMLVWWHPPTMA